MLETPTGSGYPGGSSGVRRDGCDEGVEGPSRGLGAEVVGGQPGTNPATTPPAQQTVAPGATLQMTRPTSGAEPQAAEITSSPGQGAQASPPPPERR